MMMHALVMHLRLVSTLPLLALLACRPSEAEDAGGDASASDSSSTSRAGDGDGDGDLLGGKLRIGVNHGHRNSNWGDAQDSELSRDAGCNSARLKLPETHLDTWGWDIELGDMATYAEHGKRDLVAFLIGP